MKRPVKFFPALPTGICGGEFVNSARLANQQLRGASFLVSLAVMMRVYRKMFITPSARTSMMRTCRKEFCVASRSGAIVPREKACFDC
jgi:hypothetical protein